MNSLIKITALHSGKFLFDCPSCGCFLTLCKPKKMEQSQAFWRIFQRTHEQCADKFIGLGQSTTQYQDYLCGDEAKIDFDRLMRRKPRQE
jgi:hypothetical protein